MKCIYFRHFLILPYICKVSDFRKLIKILPLRYYSYDLNNILNSLSSGSSGYTVYVMDSIVEFPGMTNYTIDTSVLQEYVKKNSF